jgi:hypothetical protein
VSPRLLRVPGADGGRVASILLPLLDLPCRLFSMKRIHRARLSVPGGKQDPDESPGGSMRTELVPAGLREQWIMPLERECLSCYLIRMLADFGCDHTLRWTLRWRDARAPRAKSLARSPVRCDCARAKAQGPPGVGRPSQPPDGRLHPPGAGGQSHVRLPGPPRSRPPGAIPLRPGDDRAPHPRDCSSSRWQEVLHQHQDGSPPQPCAGVRRGSTRPCRPTRRPPPPV